MRLAPIASRRLCQAVPPWYYRRVLRLAPVLAVCILVTACGKSVPVAQRASRTTPDSELKGQASYYAEPYHGRPTASGEIFDTYKDMTAAHRTLPFNTLVRVTNEDNGRNVDVRINDRGPFVKGRVIDLSLKAARELDMVRAGVAPVKLTILGESKKEQRGEGKARNNSTNSIRCCLHDPGCGSFVAGCRRIVKERPRKTLPRCDDRKFYDRRYLLSRASRPSDGSRFGG